MDALKIFFLIAISLILAACQGTLALGRPAYYEMAFDTYRDGQNAVILDYKLLSKSAVQFSADPTSLKAYGGLTNESIHRSALYPTDLYIKWLDRETGKEYSANASLRRTAAEDLTGFKVYPMVLGSHLYVYLISPHRNPNALTIGPGIAHGFDTELIYSN